MRIKTSQIYKAIIYFIIAWDTVLLSMFNFDPGGKKIFYYGNSGINYDNNHYCNKNK